MTEATAETPPAVIDRQAIEREFDAMMAAAPMPPIPDLCQMQEAENSAVAAAYARLRKAPPELSDED